MTFVCFQSDFMREWRRLTPTFVTDEDSLLQIFCHAAQESFHWYFAPLRMIVWLAMRLRR